METSNISRLILPTITCLLGIIIITLVSAFMYYFGDGPRKLGDFLIVFSPTIILLILLFVAWIWQFLGGTLLIVAGSCLMISYILYSNSTNSKYFVGCPFNCIINRHTNHSFRYFISNNSFSKRIIINSISV